MNTIFRLFITLIIFLSFSCNTAKEHQKKNNNNAKGNEFAQGFELQNYGRLKKITVFNQGENSIYYLIPKKYRIPDSLKDKNIIRIPVKKVVCLSTTYLGFLEKLEERKTICGVSTANLIYDSLLQERVKNGKIKEIGSYPNINIETIVELKPDIVFAYSLNGSTISQYEQLDKLGIKVILVNEYLESSPLGRAEWLKFFAAFFKKDKLAKKDFDKIKEQYLELKENRKKQKQKPGVLVNIPFQGIWYLPGGNSYMANLIEDAGGNYLWKDKKQKKSFTVNLENIFAKQDKIDILLNPGNANSLNDVIKAEPRISDMYFIKNDNIFNNNKRISSKGGNDFWESGVVCPQIILRDLTLIFSGQENNTNLYYYKKLK